MPEYYRHKAPRRGTKLSDWCGFLQPKQIIHLLTKLTDRWRKGLEILADIYGIENPFDAIPAFGSLTGYPGFEDFSIARTVHFHYLSATAFTKFRLATLAYFNDAPGREEQKHLILDLFEDEKPRIRAMRQIISHYPRIPYEDEAQQHIYTTTNLDQRLVNMDRFSFQVGQAI